jgi:hypothetical protein
MTRKRLPAAAAATLAALLAGILPIVLESSPAHATLTSAPPFSGPGAQLCYFDDQLQPYAIDGGQDAVQAQTTGIWATSHSGAYYGTLQAAVPNGSTIQTFDICYNWRLGYWYMINNGNGLFVSAEIEYAGGQSGMLRARSEQVGAWEQFSIACRGNLLTIQSKANGKYVSTELAYPAPYTDELRARATVVGTWEQYRDNDQICSTAIP